jgi:uncharacterized protein
MPFKNIIIISGLLCISMIAAWLLYIIDFKYRLPVALLLVLGTIVIAGVLSLSLQDIGLDTATIRKSLFIALPFMAVIIAGMTLAFFLNRDWFLDTRYNQPLGSVLFTVFVIIPFSTVLLEELFFRGLLFGYVSSSVSTIGAVLVSSLAFGFWHVFTSTQVELPTNTIPAIFVSIGVIALTACAGIFFTWLRIAGGNLLAPILVHWTINSFGVFLAYLAWR